MTGKGKARLAFWTSQLVMLTVTAGGIWFASRIGYDTAIDYNRAEELRHARNLMVMVERELAVNRRSLERALDDWSGDDFLDLHVVRRAYDLARGSDEFFRLGGDAVRALADAYAPTLGQVEDKIRAREVGQVSMLYATVLRHHLEAMEAAATAVRAGIVALEAKMADLGLDDHTPPPALDVRLPDTVTADEQAAAARPSSPGWGAVTPYAGPLETLSFDAHLATAARPRGPTVLGWMGTGKRLIVCTSDRQPFEELAPGEDDDRLRALYACAAPGETGVAIDLPAEQGEIVDPRTPIPWRWAYLLIEDETGARHPVEQPQSHAARAADPATPTLVLPR